MGYIFNQNLYAHILNNGWFRDVSCLPNLGSLGKLSPVMGILPWMKILLDYFWNKYKLQHCTVQQTAQTDRKVQSEPKTVMIHFYVFFKDYTEKWWNMDMWYHQEECRHDVNQLAAILFGSYSRLLHRVLSHWCLAHAELHHFANDVSGQSQFSGLLWPE